MSRHRRILLVFLAIGVLLLYSEFSTPVIHSRKQAQFENSNRNFALPNAASNPQDKEWTLGLSRSRFSRADKSTVESSGTISVVGKLVMEDGTVIDSDFLVEVPRSFRLPTDN